jgi:hypothetical protein
MGTINSSDRIAGTWNIVFLRDMVCLRNICVNTLHKGDSDDDMMMMLIIIINKRENMHTDRCGNTHKQKCHAKGSRKGNKFKSLCIEIQ